MTLAPVESLLRARIGLDPASLGPTALAMAVERRMSARHVETPAAYAGVLTADAAEWTALVAGLAVTETWFFRGGRALFDFLAAWVRDRVGPVRVLVVPCSSGEEAYSLAIALADRGVRDATIDGVDLLDQTVVRASAARYPVYSFRESGTDPRVRCFRPDGDAWELLPQYRDRVTFRTGNAVSPTFLADAAVYDLILCRNLFIYLTRAARRQVMSNLDRLLSPTGRLCLTAAEAEQLPAGRFATDGPHEFVVYRRERTPLAERAVAPLPVRANVTVVEQRPLAPREEYAPDRLATALALADAGDLDAALATCTALPPSADAFALAGVIHLAANCPDRAAEAFRKALYLDPHHAEALAHMAALHDRRGDVAQAAALRHHLARVTDGGAA